MFTLIINSAAAVIFAIQMNIAADLTVWGKEKLLRPTDYVMAVLYQAAISKPSCHFFAFVNTADLLNSYSLPQNISQVQVTLSANQLAAQKRWIYFELPSLLKKYQIDFCYCHTTGVWKKIALPAALVVPDMSSIAGIKKVVSAGQLDKKNIIVPSSFLANKIQEATAMPTDKIVVQQPAVTAMEEKNGMNLDMIRDTFSQGRNYFLYTSPLQDTDACVSVLRAFSLFKKRQRSSWKLLLLSQHDSDSGEIRKLLVTYKFRDDVQVVETAGSQLQKQQLVTAAYAIIHPTAWMGWNGCIAEAAHYGIPVLAAGGDALQNLAGEAALYHQGDAAVLAEQIMWLYKDEQVHKTQATHIMNASSVLFSEARETSWERILSGERT